MACDLTLLDLARRERTGFLRVYGWIEPTVSFGRNERTAGIFSATALAAAGLAAVRRPTGGRALLHHREITFSVAIPMDDDLRWQQAYHATNEMLLRALVSLGVPANVVEKKSQSSGPLRHSSLDDTLAATAPTAGAVCFSGIALGELAVAGRKIVASAVWRERGAYLQQGSILVDDDQDLLVRAFGQRIEPPEPAAVLSEWLPATQSSADLSAEVERAIHDSIRQCGNAHPWSIPTDIVPHIDTTREKLEQADWLWRR